MKKIRRVIFSLLLVLVLLSIPSIVKSNSVNCLPTAKATGLAMQYGCIVGSQWYPAFPFMYDSDEADAEFDTVGTIQWDYEYYDYYYDMYDFNLYWDMTTPTYVNYCLDAQATGQYADWVSNFWVGDFHNSGSPYIPAPFGHFYFYGYCGADISDNEVYIHATNNGQQSSYETFNLIWTCANGGSYWNDWQGYDEVPGITLPTIDGSESQPNYIPDNTNNHYGYIFGVNGEAGMPFAWTGRTDLSLDGFGDSDTTWKCYIGFEGPSPTMKTSLNVPPYNNLPGTSNNGEDFVTDFYYASTCWHYSAHDALNYASWQNYGDLFPSTPLHNGWWHVSNGYWWYSSMKVLGDSDVCAG